MRTASRERTTAMAATPAETRKTHRRVRDSVFHISSFFPSAASEERNGYDATPDAWPKMPTGTIIRRRALFSQVIAPARRKEPKTRVVHSSTTTREKPSMIGMESRMNSFRPGSEKSSRGEKERPPRRAPWICRAKFPRNAPARTPHANPSIPRSRPRDGGVRVGSSRRGVPRELRPADPRRAARRPLLFPPARLLRPGPEGVHPALHPDHARLLPRRGGRVDHARLRLLPPRGSDHLAEQRAPPDDGARGHLRPGVGGGVVPVPLLAGGGGEEGGDVEHAVPHPAVGLPRLRRGGGHRRRPVAGGGPPRLPARGVHDRRHDAHRLRPVRLLPRNPLLVRPGDRLPRILRDAGHLDPDDRGNRGVDRRPPAVLPPAAVVRRLRPRAGQHLSLIHISE